MLWALVAVAALQISYVSSATAFLVVVYLFALVQVARAPTWRKAFYPGLAAGFLIAVVRLGFFWRIFSGGAGALWIVAFVISPAGEIVFRQVKSVPIQFFKDGLPAPEQKLWDSPWGKIGLCICYDLSYRRVTDPLVGLGAEALIVPTMDVVDWGEGQHKLHGRVAPVRAAEYGIPIFRVASSGISQLVDRTGHVLAFAPCPGDGAIISGILELRGPGTLPLDRWLGPSALGLTGLLILGALWQRWRTRTP